MSRWIWNEGSGPASWILLCALALTLPSGPGLAEPTDPEAGDVSASPVCNAEVEEHSLRAWISGEEQGFSLLILEHISGRYLLREIDLLALGLAVPRTAVFHYRGAPFFPASRVAGASFRFHPRDKRVDIRFRPETRKLAREPFPGRCLPTLPEDAEALLLTVRINEQRHDEIIRAFRGPEDKLYLEEGALEGLRLAATSLPGRTRDGETYHPLGAIEGVTYEVDLNRMALSIDAPASAFTRTHLRASERSRHKAQSSPGGFFNYELFAERRFRSGEAADDSASDGGLYELGLFGGRGVFTTSGIARGSGDEHGWVHLESALQLDNPEHMTTTILGNSVADPGSWGNAIRFGGLSWGTDFSTRPQFVSFPLPSIVAESPAPATVDVYVNDMLQYREEVPAGPFVVDEIPMVRGSGEVRLVTRDVLGRQYVTTQSLYTSRALLKAGLHEYQYNLGQTRQAYGVESFEYGESFGAANHRYGFSDWLTGEVRVEATENWQTLGLGANVALPGSGALDLAIAGSRDSRDREGMLGQVGLERIGRYINFGARVRATRDHFQQLGEPNVDARNWRVSSAFLGFNLRRAGSINLSYVERRLDGEQQRLASARYSASLGRHASLSISALHPLDQDTEPTFRGSLTIPFGARSAISHSTQAQGERERHRTMVSRSAPVEGGLGVRALTYRGALEGEELHTHLRTGIGSYRFDVSSYGDTETYRGQARGGIAFLGGRPFLSDWIFDSFAAVEVPGGEDTPVYRDNLPVARTGADGWTLVPGLRAYERNSIRLDESELPMSLQIKDSVRKNVIPRRRSGVVVPFAISSDRTALVELRLPDGEPVPAGATARIAGSEEEHPVARDGMTYITGLPKSGRIEARWSDETCSVRLEYPDTDDPMPQIGPLTCK